MRAFPQWGGAALGVVGMAAIVAVLLAGATGPVAWLLVGLLILIPIVLVGVRLVRRPRAAVAAAEAPGFDESAPAVHDGVHRVLAVVDDACSERDVDAILADGGGPTAAFVVAPAVSSRLDRLTGDEQAYGKARERLDGLVAALGRRGVEASGKVGSHDPLQASDDGLREFPADEIVFVLHGSGTTDWVERGVVALAGERYAVPVRELRAPRGV